jgi:hypothetical protein
MVVWVTSPNRTALLGVLRSIQVSVRLIEGGALSLYAVLAASTYIQWGKGDGARMATRASATNATKFSSVFLSSQEDLRAIIRDFLSASGYIVIEAVATVPRASARRPVNVPTSCSWRYSCQPGAPTPH